MLQAADLRQGFHQVEYYRQVRMIRQALDNSLLQEHPGDQVLGILITCTVAFLAQTDDLMLERKRRFTFGSEEHICRSLLLAVKDRQGLYFSRELAALRYRFAVLLHRLLQPAEAKLLLLEQLASHAVSPDGQPDDPYELSDVYRMLGQLAEDEKDFILARQYYQLALNSIPADERDDSNLVFRVRLVTQLINCRRDLLDPIEISSEARAAIEKCCADVDLLRNGKFQVCTAEIADIHRVFARILLQEGNAELAEKHYALAFDLYNAVINGIVLYAKHNTYAGTRVRIQNRIQYISGFCRLEDMYFSGIEIISFQQLNALPLYALALLEYTLFSVDRHDPETIADLRDMTVAAMAAIRCSKSSISKHPVGLLLPHMFQQKIAAYPSLGDSDKIIAALEHTQDHYAYGYDEQDWPVIQNHLQASLELARCCAFEYKQGYKARKAVGQILYRCFEMASLLARQEGRAKSFQNRVPYRQEMNRDKRFQLCRKGWMLTYYRSAASNIVYQMDERYL